MRERRPIIKLPALNLPTDQIAAFCRACKVSEFSIFVSALRKDLRLDSDIHVLIAFLPGTEWSLLDHVQMQQEL